MVKTPIQRLIRNAIQRHKMLRAGDRIGLAVSGGADSVALLRLFEELRGELGVTVCVLHFNHQLRGANADADADFVKSLANARGVQCLTESADVAAAAKLHGWNLEDAARRLRYEFFEHALSTGAADRIATAHTADDQAETVLARVIRGTSLAGLSSIHPMRGKIIRPLIDVRRNDLRAYLAECKQEWCEDATNLDTTRLRARVRHQLLPRLERDFSSSMTERLCDLAALARDDEEFWSQLVEERYQKLIARTPKGLSVAVTSLLTPMLPASEQPAHAYSQRALTQRLVRRLHRDASDRQGHLCRTHIEQVVRLAEHGSSGRKLELPGRVTVERVFGRLLFCRTGKNSGARRGEKASSLTIAYEYEVRVPDTGVATVCVAELDRSFGLKVIDWPAPERETSCEGVVLDVERLRAPLVLRNWIPGDEYRPSGRRQTRKLARMLTAGRIDVKERALWPVLTSAGRVAWADRMPVAAEFSATNITRTGLWIFEDIH